MVKGRCEVTGQAVWAAEGKTSMSWQQGGEDSKPRWVECTVWSAMDMKDSSMENKVSHDGFSHGHEMKDSVG